MEKDKKFVLITVALIGGVVIYGATKPSSNESAQAQTAQARSTTSPIQIEGTSSYSIYRLPTTINSIIITSIVDNVNIESIILNRGNCKVNLGRGMGFLDKTLPKELKFGEQSEYTTTCDKLLEATVKTDLGDWSITFNH